MFERSNEPKLVFPALGGLYSSVADHLYPLIRFVVGAILVYHGWVKINSGVAAVAASMAKSGFEPAIFFAYAAIVLETVGGACVALGLFTRVFAAMLAIQLACITFFVMMPQGFFRMEGTLIGGIVMFTIALRGGGPYSLERAIGKEI